MSAAAAKVREYQATYRGTNEWHPHLDGGLYCTDGMKLVFEVCKAGWLFDLVRNAYQCQGGIDDSDRVPGRYADMETWRVIAKPCGSVINETTVQAWDDEPEGKAADDEPSKMLFERKLYTDFPAELSPFDFYVHHNVALLREEYYDVKNRQRTIDGGIVVDLCSKDLDYLRTMQHQVEDEMRRYVEQLSRMKREFYRNEGVGGGRHYRSALQGAIERRTRLSAIIAVRVASLIDEEVPT